MSPPRQSSKPIKPGEAGFAALGVVAGLLLIAVGGLLALAVVVSVFAPGAGEGCETLDGAGEPVGPSAGSLGGVAGSGVTTAELARVRSSPLAGSTLTAGAFRSTAYGPPWGGVQGPGVSTAGGLVIAGGAPRMYVIATDPRVISLGQWVYVWPNPFGWRGPFLAGDTGGQIRSRTIDFYDWRGRAYQNRWNQQTNVSAQPLANTALVSDDASPTPDRGSGVDAAGAQAVAKQLTGGPVGFTLVDHSGRVLGSVSPNATNRSASITKAMILIALTQDARDRALSATERDLAAAMIRRSDNVAANALFARIGAAGVNAVAARAGMTSFTLVQRKQNADGCTPASRSQEVGLALGAQAGEARLRAVVTEAGFTRFRRATETPFNLVLEARP